MHARSLLTALATVLVLAGCSGESATPPGPSPSTSGTSSGAPSAEAAAPTPPVVPPAPRQSACYRLSTRQLHQPDQRVDPGAVHEPAHRPDHLRRDARHRRGRARSRGRLGHRAAAAVHDVPPKLAAYVGGSADRARLSRFNVVWYSPTLDQSDQGADWFRCDLIAFAGEDQLASLPGTRRLRGVLDTRGALADYGLCGTSAPGARGFERVICGRGHSWRAIDTIGLAGGRSTRGTSRVRKAGDSRLQGPGPGAVGQHPEVQVRLGVADAGSSGSNAGSTSATAGSRAERRLRNRACAAAWGRAASPWRS